ncbi:MAG: fumarylacetoacetate hydrolase family protein [Micromonosporaceae bacterium]|nr:fumarylacetoacetate hydrolase family protein [Micromonosporaceae bacterium]
MKFAFFDNDEFGLVTGAEVVPIPPSLVPGTDPQGRLLELIDSYERIRDGLTALAADGSGRRPLAEVTLRPPVPRPTQLLCAVKNYADDRQGVEADFFLKSPLSLVGSGATIHLPPDAARVFHHEPELAVVIGTAGTDIPADRALSHVFGYTGFLDVSARDLGSTYYYKKSFRTFGPMGPVLVTADEIGDPHQLRVRLRVNGELRQDFSTGQMANRIDRLIEVASHVGGLVPGDVIATGTYHIGMGPLQDGDSVEMSIEHIGDLHARVVDPQQRRWDASGVRLEPASPRA